MVALIGGVIFDVSAILLGQCKLNNPTYAKKETEPCS